MAARDLRGGMGVDALLLEAIAAPASLLSKRAEPATTTGSVGQRDYRVDRPAVERADPDHVAAERKALEQRLDYHRATLQAKCAGLTAGQLKRRAVPTSNLSLLGLVRHVADEERGWFRQCATGEDVPDLYWTEADNDAGFNDIEAADAEADLDAYRREIAAARTAVAGKGLDDVVPFRWGGADRDIRWIYLHMIEEYARHNGHADLIRECIDGVTGE